MNRTNFSVVLDHTSVPPMYGIRGGNVAARRISTDYQEVSYLARCCNRSEVSAIHLMDVVEDFRHS